MNVDPIEPFSKVLYNMINKKFLQEFITTSLIQNSKQFEKHKKVSDLTFCNEMKHDFA